MEDGRLNGKVALVLGAGSVHNMGQAIAVRFAAAGAKVLVAGRQEAELQALAARIGGAYQICDITDEAQLAVLASRTRTEFGRLDIAVNATGVNQVKPFLDVDRDDLMRVVNVQLIGVFQFLQAVLREIEDNGSIIQISSISASAMLPNHAAYMSTKAAGDTLVRSLALDFGHRGIRVNSIAPGPTLDTPMASIAMQQEALVVRMRERAPLGRLGTAADVAEAALWLADDRCFITGEVLQVNGGRAIPRLS